MNIKSVIVILFFCTSLSFANEIPSSLRLNSDSLFVLSQKSQPSTEDKVLRNVNLKHFIDNGQPMANWYAQIIRLSFGFYQPVSIELCRKVSGSGYDVIIKHIAIKDIKSKGVHTKKQSGITTNIYHLKEDKVADTIFGSAARLRLQPMNAPRSAFWHCLEYYGNGPDIQSSYLKCELWGKPYDEEMMFLLLNIRDLAAKLLSKDNPSTLFIAMWSEELDRWSMASPKKPKY